MLHREETVLRKILIAYGVHEKLADKCTDEIGDCFIMEMIEDNGSEYCEHLE